MEARAYPKAVKPAIWDMPANRPTDCTPPLLSPSLQARQPWARKRVIIDQPSTRSPIKPFVHRYELRPSEGSKRANRVKGYEGKGIHRNVGIALEGSRRTQEGFLGLKVFPYLREEVRGLLGAF